MTRKIRQLLIGLMLLFLRQGHGQNVLTIQEALDLGVKNYGTVKAKNYQVQSSEQVVHQARRDYLPNLVLSAQQVYGTVNGQNGPLYGFGGFGVASSGLPLAAQNWNAGFGGLYLANFNWEVFSFGRTKGRINIAHAAENVAKSDLAQEQFQHQVRTASAYLNVLGTQRLAATQQKNLNRAEVVQVSVKARVKNGLVAGVDSALANAEVANARIALLRALDLQQEEKKRLAFLIGIDEAGFQLDSTFIVESPRATRVDSGVTVVHPTLSFYQSRYEQSQAQLKTSRKNYYPSLNLVGVFQSRASGFAPGYTADQTKFTRNYVEGISPTRSNYLVGLGLTWNLTSLFRTSAQAKSLDYAGMAAQEDLTLVKQQLTTQSNIADAKLSNALLIQREAPIQVASASEAYAQKSVLYRNGLTTMVDVTQTLYTLNRAETDRDIAFINVWQALLLKAAATGDITYFTNALNRP